MEILEAINNENIPHKVKLLNDVIDRKEFFVEEFSILIFCTIDEMREFHSKVKLANIYPKTFLFEDSVGRVMSARLQNLRTVEFSADNISWLKSYILFFG